jgi:hypothetical protein
MMTTQPRETTTLTRASPLKPILKPDRLPFDEVVRQATGSGLDV